MNRNNPRDIITTRGIYSWISVFGLIFMLCNKCNPRETNSSINHDYILIKKLRV